jgi:transposase-like protein
MDRSKPLNRNWTPQKIRQVYRLYRTTGMSYRAIGTLYGVSHTTIGFLVRRHDLYLERLMCEREGRARL